MELNWVSFGYCSPRTITVLKTAQSFCVKLSSAETWRQSSYSLHAARRSIRITPSELTTGSDSTSLTVAVLAGNVEAVRFLCESGASVELTAEHDEPILLLTAFKGNLAIVKYLMEQNANIESISKANLTLAQAAQAGDHHEVLECGAKELPTELRGYNDPDSSLLPSHKAVDDDFWETVYNRKRQFPFRY